MRRLHLFEFGDQTWFPQLLRDAETSYLATSYRLLPWLSQRWAAKVSTVLPAKKPAEILDLCAGSGGAMPAILDELDRLGHDVRATLTDLCPAFASAPHPHIRWHPEPVDATNVPPTLAGVRTIFSAFHHFRPDAAKAVLKDAFDRRCAICIFESGPGGALGVAMSTLVPPNVLLLMPFTRPFRWLYLVFTYLIPILPFIVLWDAIVSNLRVYLPEQLSEMTKDLQAPDYTWDIGLIPLRPFGGMPYLVGRPLPPPSAAQSTPAAD